MKMVLFKAIPFAKEEITLALESGVDGLIVPDEHVSSASALARCTVLAESAITEIFLSSREDEKKAAKIMHNGGAVLLSKGWEIIPVENLLAYDNLKENSGMLALEVTTGDEARLAAGILEKGVDTVVVPTSAVLSVKEIINAVKNESSTIPLTEAIITEISPVGMGHRVCVDTLSVFTRGQGMLVGNSAAFTFLVNAETEHNEYVASRPFRVNAGAVHAYAMMPEDKTTYLEELTSGSEVLIVDFQGNTTTAVTGRVKVEKRPMLLIKATAGDQDGAVFLQNAETIRLVQPGGIATSVVKLAPGDKILCCLDTAGRHFGMRIQEDITEG